MANVFLASISLFQSLVGHTFLQSEATGGCGAVAIHFNVSNLVSLHTSRLAVWGPLLVATPSRGRVMGASPCSWRSWGMQTQSSGVDG